MAIGISLPLECMIFIWGGVKVLRSSNIKGVLFDLHDTLVDKGGVVAIECALREAANFLQAQGYGISFEDYSRVWKSCVTIGRNVMTDGREFSFAEWHQQIFAGLNIPYDSEMAVQLNQHFMRGFIDHIKLIPGAVEILKRLKSNYVLGLVSNSMAENTIVDLERTGITEYFNTITISSRVGYCKPHPIIYQTAMRSLDLTAEEICFIGDNWEDDVVGPTQQGMQAIWVKPSKKQAEDWQLQAPGVAVVERIEQVLDILGIEESGAPA